MNELEKQIIDFYLIPENTHNDTAKAFNMNKNTIKKILYKYNIHKSKELIQQNRTKSIKKVYSEKDIISKRRKTNLERYGVEEYSMTNEHTNRVKATNLRLYGNENACLNPQINAKMRQGIINSIKTGIPQAKYRKTCLERYGVTSTNKLDSVKDKIRRSVQAAYATGEPQKKISESCKKAFADGTLKYKEYITKKKNGSFAKSSHEKIIKSLLEQKFNKEDIIYQTGDNEKLHKLYPWNCDFYIKSLDLFIEYQGSWRHGKKRNKIYGPYNPSNKEHQELLKRWKEKSTELKLDGTPKKAYQRAIDTWTILDVKKRNWAKEHNLNWKEFFTIDEIKDWLDSI